MKTYFLLAAALVCSVGGGVWGSAWAQSASWVMPPPTRGTPWDDGIAAVYDTLRSNLVEAGGAYAHRHARPAPRFDAVYLWDSAFIAEIWRLIDVEVGQDIIESVLENQRRDGRVPQVVNFLGTSPNTQPPLLSWSAMRLMLQGGDLSWVARVYPALVRYHEWLKRDRQLPNGLYFWRNPYESGIDNSPRFSNSDESWKDDTTQIAAVDLSAYVALDAQSLESMARALGRNAEADRLGQEAAVLRDRIDSLLWNESRGAYLDLDLRTGLHKDVLTIASFMPMTAGVPSIERARRLRSLLIDPAHFSTLIPFPSVSRSDPSFEKDCWRGPVWINMAYLAIAGLDLYGFEADSFELSRRLVDGVFQTWRGTGKFVEFYDPDRFDFEELTRKKGNWFKQLTLGRKPVAKFVGWTGLVNNLVIEKKLGATLLFATEAQAR